MSARIGKMNGVERFLVGDRWPSHPRVTSRSAGRVRHSQGDLLQATASTRTMSSRPPITSRQSLVYSSQRFLGGSVLARKIMQMRFLMTSGSRGRANNVRLLMAGFVLGACGSETSVAPTAQNGMVLSSSAQLVSDAAGRTTLAATLHVRNLSDTTARVFHGEAPCIPPLVITAYSTGSTTRVWNATEAYRNVYCYAIRYTVAIPPGQTWEYRISTPVVDVLGDSLPAGAYRFTGSAKWLEPGFPVDLELGVFALKR
jgi:hypothetical protein